VLVFIQLGFSLGMLMLLKMLPNEFYSLHTTITDKTHFSFSSAQLISLSIYHQRYHNLYSAQKDMTIARHSSAFPPTVEPLPKVFTTPIRIYVILPLIPVRDTQSARRIAPERWNHGLLHSSSWWTVVDAHSCRR